MATKAGGRACPSCGDRISVDARACACGWKRPERQAQAVERTSGCAWNEHGACCQHAGVLSSSTQGGPWYCREHWERLNGRVPDVRGNDLPAQRRQSAAVAKWHKDMNEHISRVRRVA